MPSTPRSTTARASSSVWIPLTTSLPGHCALIQRQVVEGDAGVEHRAQVLADGARPAIQRRECQRLGGQQIEPPVRVRQRVEDGAQRQRRRDRHPVAVVAQPRAGDRNVDGDQQGVESGVGRALAPTPSTGRGPATCTAETICGPAEQRSPRLRSRTVPRVDSENGIPAAAAARAPAISPSVCINRVNPVGAIPNGKTTGWPSTFHPAVTLVTSRRIVG